MSRSTERLTDAFGEFIRQVPVDDLKNNAHAWLAARLADLDLVPRAEFDQQLALLARTEARLAQLEARVAELEALPKTPPA
jgi:ubiquinone biosynthesis accessory factor UbiK